MYKKKVFKKVEKKYNSYQEKGAVGLFMKLCHLQLEINNYFNEFDKKTKILEIGAGSSPHYAYISHAFGKYVFLEKSKFAINYLKKK